MKRLFIMILAVSLCFCLPVAAQESSATFYFPGDVDGSRLVNAVDALWLLQASVGKRELSPAALRAAQMGSDQPLSAVGALSILKYAVGKDENFPENRTIVPIEKKVYTWEAVDKTQPSTRQVQLCQTYDEWETYTQQTFVDVSPTDLLGEYDQTFFEKEALMVYYRRYYTMAGSFRPEELYILDNVVYFSATSYSTCLVDETAVSELFVFVVPKSEQRYEGAVARIYGCGMMSDPRDSDNYYYRYPTNQ